MLSKLLKYDFRSLSKILVPVYFVGLLLAIITRIANMLAKEFSIFSVPSGFISAIFIIVLINLGVQHDFKKRTCKKRINERNF